MKRALAWAAWLGVASAPAWAQAPSPVVHPSPGIDPGMKMAPRKDVHLPTPVIHPPVRKGDTVVVPKRR
jgi:hypothetical protein